MWGPHSVDRFATDYNAKCSRFNSRWWCPSNECVDAFKSLWSGDINWLVSLSRLVCKVMTKLKTDKYNPFWDSVTQGGHRFC